MHVTKFRVSTNHEIIEKLSGPILLFKDTIAPNVLRVVTLINMHQT